MKYIYSKTKLYYKCFGTIHDLKKNITSKKINFQGQNVVCYQVILNFLKVQIWKPDHIYEKTARHITECYGDGLYIFKKKFNEKI